MTKEDINKAFEGRLRLKGLDGFEDCEVRQLSGKYIKDLLFDFFEAGIMLGERDKVHDGPRIEIEAPTDERESFFCTDRLSAKKLEARALKFKQEVLSAQFLAVYPPQLLQDFYNYWSEPNRSNTKMRCELQKTWDTKRRLATWARNDFNHYGTSQPTINEQRTKKLADILTD